MMPGVAVTKTLAGMARAYLKFKNEVPLLGALATDINVFKSDEF
jgi:hypothetical protein